VAHQSREEEKKSSEFLRIPNGSSELRRSANASLLLVEVLINLSNREDKNNSSEFFDLRVRRSRPSTSYLHVPDGTRHVEERICVLFLTRLAL